MSRAKLPVAPEDANLRHRPDTTTDEHQPLSIRSLTVAYHKRPALWDVNWSAMPGRLTAIVGPNGAGKSTLLKAALGLVPQASGQVRFFGEELSAVRERVAYVPQRETVDWDFPISAQEVVAMGRYQRIGWFRRIRATDRRAALECLDRVGLADYAERQISQLSGGQQQRVFLARALAREAELFLLDEPFAGVDAATERAILSLMQELRNEGATLVAVHHDLQGVPDHFDEVLLLNMRVVAGGPVADTFTEENLQRTYGGRLTLLASAAEAIARETRGEG